MCKKKHGRMYNYYMPHIMLNSLPCKGVESEDSESAAQGVAIQLFTRVSTNLEEALRYHMVLVAIRQRTMFPPSGSEHLTFEDRFHKAVDYTLKEIGMDATEMDLKFVLNLRVLWISSSLRTPPYSVVGQMQAGLADWRALDTARGRVQHRSYVLRQLAPEAIGESWGKLRQEYLRIMTWFGRCPAKIARRLDMLQQHHNSQLEKQLQRWNQVQMAAEERHQKQATAQVNLREAESISGTVATPQLACVGLSARAHETVAVKVVSSEEVELRIYRLLAKWRPSCSKGHGKHAQKRKSSKLTLPSVRPVKATCRRVSYGYGAPDVWSSAK